jgi:hypothetical protein
MPSFNRTSLKASNKLSGGPLIREYVSNWATASRLAHHPEASSVANVV